MPNNPVLVEVYRGDHVESCHRGMAVVINSAGETVFSLGAVEQSIYPRSALKIFQSIPLVESGAAARFRLTLEELAVACASHNAEEFHLRAITQWLQRLGLAGDDLECGAEAPLMKQVAHDLIARGVEPTRMHHNCSGKHTGMLTLALFMGVAASGYSEYEHPTQRAWMQTLSELMDVDVFSLPWERDGCGLPAICMSLKQLAHAFSRYADMGAVARQFGSQRATAMEKILASIRAHPNLIAGTGRCCSAIISATKGAVIAKVGAEGVYAGVIPNAQIGFAVKIEDGADRASMVALGALLDKLGAVDSATAEQLARYFRPTIINSQGKVTGRIVPSAHWMDA